MVRGQPKHVAAYAKEFLFTDNQLRQPVRSLSGGERNRLLLARALATPANLLVHNLVPLLACLDYVLFGRGYEKNPSLWIGLALPLAYFLFVMGLMFLGVRFGQEAAPYFFLDYRANGWFTAGGGRLGVFWWLLILCALALLLSRQP